MRLAVNRLLVGLIVGSASVATGCGPKPAAHRRVVMEAPVEDVPSTEISERDYGWATGARQFNARDPEGDPRVAWRLDMGAPLVHPLMTDGRSVYGTAGGQAFCVEANGTERWRMQLNATGGLAVRSPGIAVPTSRDQILDLNPMDGSITGTHDAGGVVTGHPLPLQGELVWVTEGGQVASDAGWSTAGSDSALGVPSADSVHVYFATLTGEVVAASRARARWRAVLPGRVVGGLVSADGMVFASYIGELGRPGGVAAIAADSGAVVWRVPLSDDPASGPVLGNALVIPDRSGAVVGLDPATGKTVWHTELPGSPSTALAFGEFGLYLGNADGHLHRLDPDDGGEIWSIDLGATPAASPVVLPGVVVVGLTDGSLVAIGGE